VTLALIVTIRSAAEHELAQRLVAGKPWIVRLVERLQGADSVEQVLVACREREREVEALVDSAMVSVVAADDPIAVARSLDGSHGGVAFCPVSQLFADPRRLDAVAGLDLPPDTARAFAVLACDPTIALTGGAFLEVVTRVGLRSSGIDSTSAPKTAVWQTWPEPAEMRLETWGDFDWAILAQEALLARDPSGALDQFEDALDEAGLRRFTFWDEMGPPPQSVLTVRCLRQPLFEQLVRHLRRLRGTTIDVVCRPEHADQTRSLRGVGHVFTFDGPTFSVGALGPATLDSIRERQYDLCVIPRREPTGWGFDNLVPLAEASRARAGIWLDVFGRTGLLAGRLQAWDPAGTGGPHERSDFYLRRAVRALDVYAKTPDSECEASATMTA
jgi:hypothetical protein